MPKSSVPLTDPSVEIILAYASTGLGHLRVTNALFEAATKGVYPHLLRTHDQTASTLHRLTSLHPFTRSILEWSQNGLPEEVFTRSYRLFLRLSHTGIEHEILTLIEQEFNVVKTVVIVATHFGLAHQIAGAKEALSRKLGVKIVLVVVVTDDSPQKVWYVEGADLITVPSFETKRALELYGKRGGLRSVPFAVLPYPLSPRLTESLSLKQARVRREQHDPKSNDRIQVCVPISGAAVNLDYMDELMSSLYRKNPRFYFYIVSRESMYTHPFLVKLGRRHYVSLITSNHDREIVKYYNDLLCSTTIAFEITKPSEQSFKALISRDRVGGVTLLLAEPVGRQEYDNMSFLKRNGLMDKRAFLLSNDPGVAAEKIAQNLSDGTFMKGYASEIQTTNEISSRGAEYFWKTLSNLL